MMTIVQMPTVGRIVLYKSYGTPNGEYKPEARAAVISAVHNQNLEAGVVPEVDIVVLNPTGLFFNKTVKFGTREGQWTYPERNDEKIEVPEEGKEDVS
jgi:hypothetical protein